LGPVVAGDQADPELERLRAVLDQDLVRMGREVVVPGRIGRRSPTFEATSAYSPSCSTLIRAFLRMLPLLLSRMVRITPHGEDDHREARERVGLLATRSLVGLDLVADLGCAREVGALWRHPWRAFQRGCRLLTMIVRPWRRTTVDPFFCFNDFSELLTFICLPLFTKKNGRRRVSIPPGPSPE
jgi:hypothetical protein